jgi:hypothetical protein
VGRVRCCSMLLCALSGNFRIDSPSESGLRGCPRRCSASSDAAARLPARSRPPSRRALITLTWSASSFADAVGCRNAIPLQIAPFEIGDQVCAPHAFRRSHGFRPTLVEDDSEREPGLFAADLFDRHLATWPLVLSSPAGDVTFGPREEVKSEPYGLAQDAERRVGHRAANRGTG